MPQKFLNALALDLKILLKEGMSTIFNNFSDFVLELQTLSSSNGKIALVLIFNPDKSMTLLINEVNQSMLIESHLHSNTGAIIATSL